MLTLIGPLTFNIDAPSLALSSKWLVLPLPGNVGRVQPMVSLSSTEAEFLAASDAGKMTLYLHSILDELDIPQQFATVLYEDNRGALLMASAAQPTKQSRHIEICNYALLDWVKRDLVSLEDVVSGLNSSDILTKQTGPLLFAHHVDNISGRLPQPYVYIATHSHSASCFHQSTLHGLFVHSFFSLDTPTFFFVAWCFERGGCEFPVRVAVPSVPQDVRTTSTVVLV